MRSLRHILEKKVERLVCALPRRDENGAQIDWIYQAYYFSALFHFGNVCTYGLHRRVFQPLLSLDFHLQESMEYPRCLSVKMVDLIGSVQVLG